MKVIEIYSEFIRHYINIKVEGNYIISLLTVTKGFARQKVVTSLEGTVQRKCCVSRASLCVINELGLAFQKYISLSFPN